MRARLQKLCGPEVARALWVGTFHATCAKLLRAHGEAVGVQQNFVIYDAADQKAVVARALKDLDLDEKRCPPRAVLSAIHKHKQEGRGPDEAAAHSYVDDIALQGLPRLRAAAARGQRGRLRGPHPAGGAPPRGRPGEGDRIRRRYDYVLVDEFQDTNATQYRFLRDLVRDHKNLCVVGDDDQSIYRWRGADVRNIRGFRRDYPERHRGQARAELPLDQAHRRRRRSASSRARTSASPRSSGRTTTTGVPIHIVAARDERDEAAFVVEAVKRARGEGVDPREIAVFYRIHAQSRVLEEALRAANVPYQIIGGMKFYERAEVKDALAYLRVLVEPGERRRPRAHRQRPGARHRTDHGRAAHARGRPPTGVPLFDALARVEEVGDLGAGSEEEARRPSARCSTALQRAHRDAPPSEVARRRARDDGLHRHAQEGRQRRGRRPHREPRRARRLAAGLRGRGGRGGRAADARRLPRARHACERRRHDEGRRQDHPHDGARRQGPGVRAGHAHGDGRRDVPVQGHRSRRARGARGGAAPGLRGHHPRAQGARDDAHADAPDLRHHALEPPEPLPRRASRRQLRARRDAAMAGGRAALASSIARRTREPVAQAVAPPAGRRRTGARSGAAASWTTSSSTTARPTT